MVSSTIIVLATSFNIKQINPFFLLDTLLDTLVSFSLASCS
jgi:hypothetical protein